MQTLEHILVVALGVIVLIQNRQIVIAMLSSGLELIKRKKR